MRSDQVSTLAADAPACGVSSHGSGAVQPVGETLGVEEEYHLVDAATFEISDQEALNDAALEGDLGSRVEAEISTTQLEIATLTCCTLEEVREDLLSARRQAATAAQRYGAHILAASTHPAASWQEQRLTSKPRYLELVERFGALALQQVICGCHVHVAVPDVDTAVGIMDHARPHLPVLLALTGSSPFHEGTDTGYDSYRTEWFSRWPIAGPADALGDADGYRRLVDELTQTGVIDDSSHLYWDLRPSARYPTLEFRVADVCTEVDDAVLHAALVRALCRVLARRVAAGEPAPSVRGEVLRAARWRAARHGLDEQLFDFGERRLVPAGTAVERFLAFLREDLDEHDEWDTVRELVGAVLERGTSAHRQRDWLHQGDSQPEIARRLVEITAASL